MQLSRNLFLSPERTLSRKLQETMLAIQIERRFTKQQIFAMYCNQIYLGHGMYGFEAGSQYYFNKHARDLSLDEAALLAGLPKSPTEYSPVLHPERALARRNLVINAMLEDGKITAAEASRLKALPVKLSLTLPNNNLAPWFFEEIRRYLEKRYGSDQVHQGGLRVYTSLDTDLQNTAKQAVLDGVAAYERRHGWKGNLRNVVKEGANLKSYSHPDWDEPIAVNGYEHALVTGVSGSTATVRLGKYSATLAPPDVAWTGKRASQLFKPGDLVYVKVLTLRPALAESRNIPALKLAERLSMKTVIDYAHRFGVTSPLPAYLPVALGAAEISLYEQTAAFSTFPNDGVRVTPRYIRRVTDYDGRILEENYPEVRDVVSANTARVMTTMLREVVLRGTAAKASTMKYALAGKTGTTNDFTDAWFVGFSPFMTCGVWVGFDENRSLGPKETGAQAALPIWMDFMKVALTGHENEQFTPPTSQPARNGTAVAQKEDTPEIKAGEDTEAH